MEIIFSSPLWLFLHPKPKNDLSTSLNIEWTKEILFDSILHLGFKYIYRISIYDQFIYNLSSSDYKELYLISLHLKSRY